MAREFSVDILSKNSITRLQRELSKYRDGLAEKTKEFARRLAESGVEIASLKIVDLDAVFTGELLESMKYEQRHSKKYEAVFLIIADSKHGAFVEFGTGYKGLNSSYPYNFPDGVTWNYNTGKTIKYNSVTGTYYWFYPGDDGKWHYTEGMPARPFMYETANELRQNIEDIAMEVFGDA